MIRALSHLGSLEPLSPVLVYDSPFITNTTRRTAVVSLVGSPSRAIMSACMSGLSEPISLSKSALARAEWRTLRKGHGF